MTLQDKIDIMIKQNTSIIRKTEELIEENEQLRKHIDALTIMSAKTIMPQFGIDVVFSDEEIADIQEITGLRLVFDVEEYQQKDGV
ncbi:MAG: hypothetical protein FWE33_04780 [Defluviitaleaceae bacterium]|nr:hypothetical protein [Defluviitaleaceae bacterium]